MVQVKQKKKKNQTFRHMCVKFDLQQPQPIKGRPEVANEYWPLSAPMEMVASSCLLPRCNEIKHVLHMTNDTKRWVTQTQGGNTCGREDQVYLLQCGKDGQAGKPCISQHLAPCRGWLLTQQATQLHWASEQKDATWPKKKRT